MLEEVVADFLDYLRRAAFPRPFLPVYEREARRFLSAFPDRSPVLMNEEDVVTYLGAARAAGATEQQLKDLKVVSEAVVWFLKHRTPAAARPAQGRGRRRHKRVPFVREIWVKELGQCRSSDLSRGGLFLETPASVSLGTELQLTFAVFEGEEMIQARARVVYQQPQVGVGLMFLGFSPGGQDIIDAYVSRAPESEAEI